MRRLTREEQQEIIKNYNSGLTMKQCGELQGVTASTVLRVLNAYGVPKRTKGGIYKLPESKIISEYLCGMSTIAIADKYNVTCNTIINILKVQDIKRDNRYANLSLDINYFETIDTVDKAYFLGFLIADGSINSNDNTVSLSLSSKDVDILKIFANCVHSSNKLYYRKDKPEVSFRVKCNKWKQDLAQYGVVPRKTDISYIPRLNLNLMSHLIRGLIDGDGWVSYKSHQIGFCGNELCVTQLRDYLVETLGVYKVTVLHAEPHLWQVTWASKNDISIIGNYIYKDKQEFFLKRKYDNFLKIYGNTEVSS